MTNDSALLRLVLNGSAVIDGRRNCSRGGAVVNAACWRRDLVRRARAQVEHRIAAGELTAAEVILGSRWEIDSMQIGEVLISRHDWGALAVDRTGRVHLEDLRDLQRHGRESLARTTDEPRHRSDPI